MERITKFYPAFDKRDPDSSKNYGIHGVDLRMVLKGKLGAVQYVQHCNWHLDSVNQDQLNKGGSFIYKEEYPFKMIQAPSPVDLGYHSPKPMYDGHTPIGSTNYTRREPTEEEKASGIDWPQLEFIPVPEDKIPICEYLGCPCYYDGSSLAADKVFDILLEKGSDGVWEYLEEYYIQIFGKLE